MEDYPFWKAKTIRDDPLIQEEAINAVEGTKPRDSEKNSGERIKKEK